MSNPQQQESSPLVARVVTRLWRYRRDIAVVVLVAATAGVVLVVPRWRQRLATCLRHARLRRRLAAGMTKTKVGALAGRLPRIARMAATPVGTRVTLRLPPGTSADMVQVRAPELATACRARAVRIVRDDDTAHRMHLDVVTRDPLDGVEVPWADRRADRLSMFDPVHIGLGEDGLPVRRSFEERSLLVVGLAGTGKSSLLQTVVAHGANSPDALLALVDPNGVQLHPWRDRAWLYAGADIDDALDVATQVHAEMTRRLEWLQHQPGVARKIRADMGVPLLLFVIDELAYHMSIAGTGQQRALWAGLVRDVASRGRAAGVIPVAATQRPTNEVVPASFSQLFAMRACGRVTDSEDSDRVLGKGSARAGWDASTIPLTSRGVLMVTSEDGPAQRIKGAWLSDEAIAELSVTSVRHRPPSPAERLEVAI